jgi:hypothetical protein
MSRQKTDLGKLLLLPLIYAVSNVSQIVSLLTLFFIHLVVTAATKPPSTLVTQTTLSNHFVSLQNLILSLEDSQGNT